MTPSLTPSIVSQAATAAAVAAANLHAGTKLLRLEHHQRAPHLLDVQLRPVDRGRAGEDAVVVGGVALRFHQALPPAGRAAVEVRVARRVAVERRASAPCPSPSSRGCRDRRCRESAASSGGPPHRARSCRCRLHARYRSRRRHSRLVSGCAHAVRRCRRRIRRRRRPETGRSSPAAATPMKILTASPAGGCVTIAVTRHDAGMVALPGSTTADSIVVFGKRHARKALARAHGLRFREERRRRGGWRRRRRLCGHDRHGREREDSAPRAGRIECIATSFLRQA